MSELCMRPEAGRRGPPPLRVTTRRECRLFRTSHIHDSCGRPPTQHGHRVRPPNLASPPRLTAGRTILSFVSSPDRARLAFYVYRLSQIAKELSAAGREEDAAAAAAGAVCIGLSIGQGEDDESYGRTIIRPD